MEERGQVWFCFSTINVNPVDFQESLVKISFELEFHIGLLALFKTKDKTSS